MERQLELVCDLSNGANDLELPLTQMSRSSNYLTLNIPETVGAADIVAMKY